MKTLLSFAFCLGTLACFAQQPKTSHDKPSADKGVKPFRSSSINPTLLAGTRAVVVGISDYQDPGIPDLRFADRDAEAFANFLRSPAGGSLDADHLKILTNSGATAARFAAALDWLLEECREGEQAIIYFSGHGDVERKTISQPGYLLCWDTPSRVYMGGGAFNLRDLEEVVSTLSTQNKVKTLVIADACHAGKLSGSGIGGAQITGANLARQYASELKILSCQPNEYSIEGEQWGGGRGAFSYHLVDGLLGLADGNADETVSLLEIGRYLEDRVSSEVAPQNQLPMTIGNRSEKLAAVFPELLVALKKNKSGQMPTISATDNRGMEEEVLASVDTTVRMLYRRFKKALENKVFLEPAGACADAYYERLVAEPKLSRLHASMRRNYAAALQDDAQQALNKCLKSDLGEYAIAYKTGIDRSLIFSRYLERAAELLGRQHYMYPVLQARKNYFEGCFLSFSNFNPNKEVGEKALAKYRQALHWQPEMPQAYWGMSWVFAMNLLQPDSAAYYGEHAAALSPSWLIPYVDLAWMSLVKWRRADRGKYYLEQADLIDSNSVIVLDLWGVLGQRNGLRSEQIFRKVIALDSSFAYGHYNLANILLRTGRFEEAELHYKKAIQSDSTHPWYHAMLGVTYSARDRVAEAEQAMRKAIRLDSTSTLAYFNLAPVYSKLRRFEEAEVLMRKVMRLDSTTSTPYYNIACWRSLSNQVDTAYAFLEMAFKHGWKDYTLMNKDPDLSALREQTERWATLMKKYFPHIVYYNLACAQSLENQVEAAYGSLEQALVNGWTNYGWAQQDPDLAHLRERAAQWKALMKKYFPDKD